MRHPSNALLNTVLRAAATALIGAGGLADVVRRRARPERAAGHRQAGLLLRRRHHRRQARGLADGRPHVCGVPGAAEDDAPVSGGDDPRRQPDRHQLHRHAGRARGLGAVLPAPRLRGLRGRPGGARARRAVVAGERAGVGVPIWRGSSSASSRRSASTCGRRRICTPSGRATASRATRASTSSMRASSPRSPTSRCSRRSTATPRWRCSTASARRW